MTLIFILSQITDFEYSSNNIPTITNNNTEFYLNYQILLPNPNNIDVVYNNETIKNNYFKIFRYTPKKVKTIISNKKFKPMNYDFIKEKLETYYKSLNEEEQQLFNNNINGILLDNENYYAYIDNMHNMNYLILILDTKTNSLYVSG